MNRQSALLALCLFYNVIYAQEISGYQKDLKAVYEILQKTPSFKDQITGAKEKEYRQLYKQLNDRSPNSSRFDSLYKFSRLLSPIKDNHLGIYEVPVQQITMSMLKDSDFIERYRSSATFKNFPKAMIPLDSLENSLSLMPADSVPGIYSVGHLMKIGVYRTSKSDSLVGVVLSTTLGNWQRGQLAFILKQNTAYHFEAIYANVIMKFLVLLKNVKFIEGTLTGIGSKRTTPDLGRLPDQAKIFELKWIAQDIQYLRLGRFSSSNEALKESTDFYMGIKDSLKAKNLIVDLRNNPGGGDKSSAKFLSLLKKYSRRANIHAIINHGTYSNAEQFTLKLKKLENVQTYGETTNGTLTYGNNYGKAEPLPSGKYSVYITDMKDNGHYLPYEGIGINPDVTLNRDSDWIDQVEKRIKQGI